MPDAPIPAPAAISPDRPALTPPTCGNCRHLVPDPMAPEERGFCRRFPPTVFLTAVNRDPQGKPINNESMAMFPVVALGIVCGEWGTTEPVN